MPVEKLYALEQRMMHRHRHTHTPESQKFFASFFQKRSASFP
jgi:hypothetical protein